VASGGLQQQVLKVLRKAFEVVQRRLAHGPPDAVAVFPHCLLVVGEHHGALDELLVREGAELPRPQVVQDAVAEALVRIRYLGTAGAVGTALTDGMTQFDAPLATAFVIQDGNRFGNFVGVKADEDGIVTALFDNGETVPIYKLPIATFPNPNGLDAQTGNVFSQSGRSGDYFLCNAREANAGIVMLGALEASTTDLAEEFTNMIITQRAYSASTPIITTADDMLHELIHIAN